VITATVCRTEEVTHKWLWQTHHNRSSIHHENTIAVHHCVQTMGNCQNCTVGKFMTDCCLNEFIGPEMHRKYKILTSNYQSAKACRHLQSVHEIMVRFSDVEILKPHRNQTANEEAALKGHVWNVWGEARSVTVTTCISSSMAGKTRASNILIFNEESPPRNNIPCWDKQ
jgi:hypothetical protein